MSSSEYWPEYFIYFTTETLDLKFMETSGDRNSVSTFPQRLKVFLNFHPLGMEGSCLLYLASSLEEHFLILFGYFWQYLTISPTSLPAVWPSEVLGFKQCWGGGNGNAVNFIFHLQISGYLADTFRADGKLSTTHIRKLFTCGAYLGQVISELECPVDVLIIAGHVHAPDRPHHVQGNLHRLPVLKIAPFCRLTLQDPELDGCSWGTISRHC